MRNVKRNLLCLLGIGSFGFLSLVGAEKYGDYRARKATQNGMEIGRIERDLTDQVEYQKGFKEGYKKSEEDALIFFDKKPYVTAGVDGDTRYADRGLTFAGRTEEEIRRNVSPQVDIYAVLPLTNIKNLNTEDTTEMTSEIISHFFKTRSSAPIIIYATKEMYEKVQDDVDLQRAMLPHISPDHQWMLVPKEYLQKPIDVQRLVQTAYEAGKISPSVEYYPPIID